MSLFHAIAAACAAAAATTMIVIITATIGIATKLPDCRRLFTCAEFTVLHAARIGR